MPGNSRLVIHTQILPENASSGGTARRPAKVRWRSVAHPRAAKGRFAAWRRRYAPGDRLLRDTAIACALLLTVLALRDARLPWTTALSQGVERAVTMKIDLDETLGKLYFVRELVPETANVFWNAAAGRMIDPVEGEIWREYAPDRPWRVYACEGGARVVSAYGGEVQAVEQGAAADWIVIVTHDNGLQGVYAYMAEVSVRAGDRLESGSAIGCTAQGDSARLYFALRLDGEAADPSEYM